MAEIQNQDLINSLRVAARISNSEAIPKELGKTIVPIVDSTPYKFSNFIISAASNTTGAVSNTFPTVSVNGDTYITGLTWSLIKDSTCDQATGTISITITSGDSGISVTLVRISVITLTAQSESGSISFPFPIKIKNGTVATFSTSFSVGVLSRGYSFIGFTTS